MCSARVITFSDGFTSASVPTGAGGMQEDYTIANNTTGGALVTFAQADNKTIFMDYELRRTSSGGTYLQSGRLIAAYDGSWLLTEGAWMGDEMIVSTITSTEHVKLTLNSSTGALTYDSGNLAGTSYVGTLKINSVRIV